MKIHAGYASSFVLVLLLSSGAFAQAQPEMQLSQSSVSAAEEAPSLYAQAALAAANAEIERKVRARNVKPGDASLEAVAAIARPSGEYDLVVRYRLGWAEWSVTRRLPAGENELAANAAQAVASLDLSPLDATILAQSEADRIVKTCDSRLAAVVRPLASPFFRRPTNVRWDETTAAPFLRSFAPIPGTNNQCARTDLNLVTGVVMCRRVACTTR